LTGPTGQITIFIDGGSRGNPGPAAAAYVLSDERGNRLDAQGFYLGQATNNFAEYTALLRGLQAAKQIKAKKVRVLSDSELLVRQINGEYKVKNADLQNLHSQSLTLLEQFPDWQVKHITREKNKEADKLVNKAINLQRDVREEAEHPAAPGRPIRLGVLISGGGTTLMNILEYIKKGRLNAELAVVISSRSTVSGVEKAKKAGLAVKIIRTKDYPDIDEFSRRIEEELNAVKVDLVVQGGWLCLWKIPKKYENRVMNIHPALLPSFGGQGMWGHHVHEAVLKAGCKVGGCTVHFCTNEYDKGPIIVQKCCKVEEGDTPESLAARVFEQECLAYPEAIKLFAEDRISVQDNTARIKNA
jgi:phosphoribosylglycinamide formyltransferase-1